MAGERKHRERGKARERQVAAAFGTLRTPLSGGSSRHTRSDTLHGTLFIEVKERHAQSLYTLYDEVAAKAKAEGKIPVLAIAETGRPGFLIACHVGDLQNVVDENFVGEIVGDGDVAMEGKPDGVV